MSRFIPIFAILIALGLFFGYINPTMNGPIAVAKQQIKDYNSALDAAKRFREKEAELAQARSAIPPESIVRLESFLPDGVDNVQLILDLDALASRTGLSLSGFSTDEQVASTESASETGIVIPSDSPLDSIELSVSGKGDYPSFRSFLAATEQSLRPLDLTKLEIKTGEDAAHTYSMAFRLYWLR